MPSARAWKAQEKLPDKQPFQRPAKWWGEKLFGGGRGGGYNIGEEEDGDGGDDSGDYHCYYWLRFSILLMKKKTHDNTCKMALLNPLALTSGHQNGGPDSPNMPLMEVTKPIHETY